MRLGRLDEAIEVSSQYLAGLPDSALFCPGVAQLCQRAGDPKRLAEIARDRRDLVNYTAALLSIASREPRRGRRPLEESGRIGVGWVKPTGISPGIR